MWTVVYFILLGLCIISDVIPTYGEHGCSFTRSYQDEQCTYNIQLTQVDNNCGAGKPYHLDSFVMDSGNDYTQKISTMEKTVSYMKDEHEKRLKDLEGTVRDLLGMDKVQTLIQNSANGLEQSRSSNNGRVVDASLLTHLQEEFGKLREALTSKTYEILDMQAKVNETSALYEKSQMDLFTINQDLLDAENKIAILERERAILKNQLKDRSYKMDVSSGRLADCEKNHKDQQDQLLKLIRSENTLIEELATCQLVLNKSKVELGEARNQHQELKTRHNRIREILSIRETELIDCYQAKTQSFCGFETKHLCGFTQPNDTSDYFDWDWGKGSTPSRGTGPSADHTCESENGHFMFIEASAKARGNNAIIYSPLYRGLVEQCLEFYYHMYGKNIGTLNVYAKARGAELASVWRAFGNQGDLWSLARLSIPKELARAGYQIAFEGITENGYQGDMAIDDISVTDGPCPVGSGLQAVKIQFNGTSTILDEAKDFARSIRKSRLGRIKKLKRHAAIVAQ